MAFFPLLAGGEKSVIYSKDYAILSDFEMVCVWGVYGPYFEGLDLVRFCFRLGLLDRGSRAEHGKSQRQRMAAAMGLSSREGSRPAGRRF